jgi:hypothetical protein
MFSFSELKLEKTIINIINENFKKEKKTKTEIDTETEKTGEKEKRQACRGQTGPRPTVGRTRTSSNRARVER